MSSKLIARSGEPCAICSNQLANSAKFDFGPAKRNYKTNNFFHFKTNKKYSHKIVLHVSVLPATQFGQVVVKNQSYLRNRSTPKPKQRLIHVDHSIFKVQSAGIFLIQIGHFPEYFVFNLLVCVVRMTICTTLLKVDLYRCHRCNRCSIVTKPTMRTMRMTLIL